MKVFSDGTRGLIRFILLLFVLCAGSGTTAREISVIKSSGKLIVAVPELRTPPFFFEKDGELMGLDIELAKAIAQSLGVQVEFNHSGKTFDDAIDLVAKDKADVSIAKISRTITRAQAVLFTDPYISLRHALLVNRLRFAEISRGKPVAEVMQNYSSTIGVIRRSSFATYARTNFPHAKVVEFDSWDEVVKAVADGEICAAYRDEFEVRRVLKIHPNLSVRVRSVVIDDIQDTIGIAVGPSNPFLLSFLNVYLQQRNVRYTSDQILKNYRNFLE